MVDLHQTKRGHVFGGVCQGIGGDLNNICIGSQRYVEFYDLLRGGLF